MMVWGDSSLHSTVLTLERAQLSGLSSYFADHLPSSNAAPAATAGHGSLLIAAGAVALLF